MGNKPCNTELFDRAMIYAINAHHGTERRGKQSPYVIHPMEAVEIVATITNDQELLAAAALHDVIEDTEYTEEDIRREFGDRVADLVASESDSVIEGKDEVESWKERKQFGIDRLKIASRDAKVVAIGDKLSNLRAISRDYEKMGDELWKIFHAPDPSFIEWRYRALLDAFEGLEDTAPYQEFSHLIDRIWGHKEYVDEARLIDVDDWESFGGGYTAQSYFNRHTDSVMMKLYEAFMPESEAIHEYMVSKAIKKTGLDIPAPICMVKTEDGRHGVVFERIKQKKSISRAISLEPEKLEYYAGIFAECSKELHKVPCDMELFRDIKEICSEEINKAVFFTDEEKEKLIKFIYSVPDTGTSLHGDCHIGNLLISGARTVWIDLADWAYGNPLFDQGLFHFICHMDGEDMVMNLYHINCAQMKKVWEKYVEITFPGEKLEEVNERLKPFGCLKTVSWANRNGLKKDGNLRVSVEYLKEMCKSL